MAKGKLKAVDKVIEDLKEAKPILIKDASISDGFCNYSYEIVSGIGLGDTVKRKGSSVVHDDLINAINALNVHLAITDDAFKYKGIEVNSIDEVAEHEVRQNYHVTGIKISGGAEDESVVLIGSKWVSYGSIGLETPKIKETGVYPFKQELFEALDLVREEVYEYMMGKTAPKFEQAEMTFEISDQQFSEAAV